MQMRWWLFNWILIEGGFRCSLYTNKNMKQSSDGSPHIKQIRRWWILFYHLKYYCSWSQIASCSRLESIWQTYYCIKLNIFFLFSAESLIIELLRLLVQVSMHWRHHLLNKNCPPLRTYCTPECTKIYMYMSVLWVRTLQLYDIVTSRALGLLQHTT